MHERVLDRRAADGEAADAAGEGGGGFGGEAGAIRFLETHTPVHHGGGGAVVPRAESGRDVGGELVGGGTAGGRIPGERIRGRKIGCHTLARRAKCVVCLGCTVN